MVEIESQSGVSPFQPPNVGGIVLGFLKRSRLSISFSLASGSLLKMALLEIDRSGAAMQVVWLRILSSSDEAICATSR
jgi:hypothetical protein